MLYYLFQYLDEQFNFPGAGLFGYISFRAFASVILSLIISLLMGESLINMLRRKQVGETVRDLGLEGQKQKEGTPTMGGLIILAAILIPTLCFAQIKNIYVIMAIIATVWLGFIGFLDDYIKVFKKDKKGLAGKFKIVGQVGLGLIIGSVMYFDNDITYKKEIPEAEAANYPAERITEVKGGYDGVPYKMIEHHAPVTSIPFVKEHELNYSKLLSVFSDNYKKYGWILYIPVVIFIITAVSNGANLTDGIDGLATGTSAIIGVVLAVLAYVSGNVIFADYLNVMYIPNLGELTIFIGAFVGACVGFLWYNAYPAKVFMGDTGSLALGGIIAALAIMMRKELLLPIMCGIFLIENLSVVMQVSYFKFTKRKYGEGRRIFLMSPLHHHYQKKGWHEAKIVTRFWIIGILLAVLTMLTLKIR